MKRELKRGETYKDAEGTIWTHDRDGKFWAGNAKKRQEVKPREFEVGADVYAKNPGIWVPTEEEKEAAKRNRLAQEVKWHALRGKEPSGKLLASLGLANTAVLETPQDKEMPDVVGCEDCGGPRRGRGYAHAEDCAQKRQRG